MGIAMSVERPALDAERKTAYVEQQLIGDGCEKDRGAKILLLGSGDSGKTTVVKQMQLVLNHRWSRAELDAFRDHILDDLTLGAGALIGEMEGFGTSQCGNPHHSYDVRSLKTLWEHPNVQNRWKRANEVTVIPENLSYENIDAYQFSIPFSMVHVFSLLTNADRLCGPGYIPSEQDIMRIRIKTTGIYEFKFYHRGQQLRVVDTGGQRSERRKWIHAFPDVTVLLFFVSLNGYDLCLVEDENVNQMHDAMIIWRSICQSRWFKDSTIILLLNKDDLFREKIKTSDIRKHFPDYDGTPGDYQQGLDYFKRRFLEIAQKPGELEEREIPVHVISATDTEMIQKLMVDLEVSSILATFHFLANKFSH